MNFFRKMFAGNSGLLSFKKILGIPEKKPEPEVEIYLWEYIPPPPDSSQSDLSNVE